MNILLVPFMCFFIICFFLDWKKIFECCISCLISLSTKNSYKTTEIIKDSALLIYVCDCGLITILTQLNRQNRQCFIRFIKVQKWFSSTKSLLFQCLHATLTFLGHFPRAKYLIFLKQLSKYI